MPDRQFIQHAFEFQGGEVLNLFGGVAAAVLKGPVPNAVVQHEPRTPFAGCPVLERDGNEGPFAGRDLDRRAGSLHPARRGGTPDMGGNAVGAEEVEPRQGPGRRIIPAQTRVNGPGIGPGIGEVGDPAVS